MQRLQKWHRAINTRKSSHKPYKLLWTRCNVVLCFRAILWKSVYKKTTKTNIEIRTYYTQFSNDTKAEFFYLLIFVMLRYHHLVSTTIHQTHTRARTHTYTHTPTDTLHIMIIGYTYYSIPTSNSIIKNAFIVSVTFLLHEFSLLVRHFIENLLQEKWFKILSVKRFESRIFCVFEDRISPLYAPCKHI